MIRYALGIASLVLFATACGGRTTTNATPHDGEPAALVEADTEMACSRTRSAGAWTQLVYRTTTWSELARRADARDPDAWNEIGDRIEHNRRHVRGTACTETMVRDVRASAARLSGSE